MYRQMYRMWSDRLVPPLPWWWVPMSSQHAAPMILVSYSLLSSLVSGKFCDASDNAVLTPSGRKNTQTEQCYILTFQLSVRLTGPSFSSMRLIHLPRCESFAAYQCAISPGHA
jgi:hypothetical protein